jgi:hypothetical protein
MLIRKLILSLVREFSRLNQAVLGQQIPELEESFKKIEVNLNK